MVGLDPTIHLTACSGVRGWLDPRGKPEDDNGTHSFDLEDWALDASTPVPTTPVVTSVGKLFGDRLPDVRSRLHARAVLHDARDAGGIDAVLLQPLRQGEEIGIGDRVLQT